MRDMEFRRALGDWDCGKPRCQLLRCERVRDRTDLEHRVCDAPLGARAAGFRFGVDDFHLDFCRVVVVEVRLLELFADGLDVRKLLDPVRDACLLSSNASVAAREGGGDGSVIQDARKLGFESLHEELRARKTYGESSSWAFRSIMDVSSSKEHPLKSRSLPAAFRGTNGLLGSRRTRAAARAPAKLRGGARGWE